MGKKLKSSLDKGVDPKKFTDQVSENFRALSDILNLDNDDFIRTTEDRHIKSVQNLWNRLLENDEIYLSKYSGWYSVRDEAFVAENEITEKDGKNSILLALNYLGWKRRATFSDYLNGKTDY